MTAYTAPSSDMRFLLWDLHGGEEILTFPDLHHVTRDDVDMVLDEAGRFAGEVLAPLNRSGDEEGCTFENGTVRTPAGFRAAFDRYREAGWPTLVARPEHGGQGLPHVVQTLVDEMLASANLAFTSYPGLSQAAYQALAAHGDPVRDRAVLERLADGRWTGTMCLTEPHCGSDLALVRTRAEPLADGSFAVTGTKIFISAGDHDMAENIVHLVLARLPDASPGIRGLSLFLVPKLRHDAEGRLGTRNAVAAIGLEHKMGLKGSATCQMAFDGAVGHLVGEPGQGMRTMFSMMNVARLAVAMQGIGLAEVARARAGSYACDRRQGRALDGRGDTLAIVEHADVKRMLLTLRGHVEGLRALAVWIGLALDRRAHHPDAAERARAEDLVALLTPVAKALGTDLGVECTSLAMQVWGGHGYIRDNGMEQYLRDARIGPIYEGTNGIQAADLVGRKLADDGDRRLATVLGPIEAFLAAHRDEPAAGAFVAPLARAATRLKTATTAIRAMAPEEANALATTYLRLFGLTVIGWLWARMALISLGHDDDFHRAKVATARFWLAHPLAETATLAEILACGGAVVADVASELVVFGEAA